MKKITSVITLFAFCVLPIIADAQSTADIQAQAQVLLQQVQQLQSQISANGGSTTATASGCPSITRTLKLGSSGSDVTALQQFLAADPSVYPEGTVSGYFGALTQAAVQRWQTKYNIVSSGSPSTTGYGVVGPRTAAAIALQCSQKSGTTSPVVGGYMQISPVTGAAPLSVNVTAYVNSTLSCSAVNYTLDFGDGTAQQILPVAAGGCQQVSQQYTHIYIYGGVYQITLAAGGHKTVASVSVSGPAQPTTGTTGTVVTTPVTQTYANTFSLSTTTGVAPFSVSFNAQNLDPSQQYAINFGDGTTNGTLSSGISGQQVTHVYQTTGTFTAQLLASNAVVQSATVTATAVPASTSYGIVSVTPTAGTKQIVVQLSVPACPTYTFAWGDGATTAGTPASGCSTSGASLTPSLNHTYTAAGFYNLTLTDGNGVAQAGASVTLQ